MKLKCIPEDFVVTEITSRRPSDGPYALYELKKRSLGTLEALQILQRCWNLAAWQCSHGGLKDRHAVTTQQVTVKNGPRSNFQHDLFELTYLGQTSAPLTAGDIVSNHFQIVVRSLSDDGAVAMTRAADVVAQTGFPNYFDQQRFGSLGVSQEYVAAKWCLKDYERALWLALADHNPHDNSSERQQKEILQQNWGQWAECKQQLERSHRRSVVTYLVDHPTNFRKAFALINSDLRGLYLSAFQSAVWNRMLKDVTLQRSNADHNWNCITIADSDLPILPINRQDPADNESLPNDLPLPSSRCKSLSDDERSLCDRALAAYQLTLPTMKLSFPRDRWFSRGRRQTVIRPTGLSAVVEADERYGQRSRLTLSFELDRGCYATMLIKCLTGRNSEVPDDVESEETESAS